MHRLTTLFHDRHDAEQAIHWLRGHGYREDEIGIVVHDGAHAEARAARNEEQSLGETFQGDEHATNMR